MAQKEYIRLYDYTNRLIAVLENAYNIEIEEKLGEAETLSFSLPFQDPKADLLMNDEEIIYNNKRYIITQITDGRDEEGKETIDVFSELCYIELLNYVKPRDFEVLNCTPEQGLVKILEGTHWQIGTVEGNISNKYSLKETNQTVLYLIRQWAKITGLEILWDSIDRKVSLVNQVGSNNGAVFRYKKNIKSIKRTMQPPQATVLYPYGANNLTISAFNNGKEYLEDYSWYISQGFSENEARAKFRKEYIWQDDSFLSAGALVDAAVKKLAELSQPVISYECTVLDLSSITGLSEDDFGKAIMVEEGTTNLLPSNDAQGKTLFYSNNSSYSSNTLETSFGLNDLYSVKSVQLVFSSNQGFFSPCYPTVAGKVYTFSYYVYNATSTSHNFTAMLIFYDGSGNLVQSFESNRIPVPAQQWERISVTATAPSGSTQCRIIGAERNSTSQVGDVYYFDSFQLEQKPYVTSFIDGTRSPEILTIPNANVFNKSNWNLEFQFNPTSNQVVSNKIGYLWENYIDANNYYALKVGSDGKPYLEVKSNGTIYQTSTAAAPVLNVGTWYDIKIRGNGSLMAIAVNGTKISEVSYAEPVGNLPANMYIGSDHNGSNHANGLFDDLRISAIARSDTEWTNAYTSGQPLPIDENTTYALRFDNSLKVGRGGYRRNKIYLQSLGTCQGSHIEWSAEIPTNTTAKVYTSLDDVNFTEAVNGAAIEGLSEGVSLSDKALTIKQIMTTEDVSITPKFNRLQYSISGKVYLRG